MKKIAAAILAASFTGAPVFAQNIDALYKDGTVVISQDENMPSQMLIAGYDNSGRLSFVTLSKAEYGSYSFELDQKSNMLRAYDIGNNTYDINVIEESVSTTEPTAAPESTSEPTAAPQKYVHPAYENESDQVTAFGIVEKVVTSINANNEKVYKAITLIQNKRAEIEIATDIEIKTAPAQQSSLIGMPASALREGDAVFYETNISGNRVKSIDLIYRPSNVFYGNTKFENYFSLNGAVAGKWAAASFGNKLPSERYVYAFGVITDCGGGNLTLYPKTGIGDDALDINYTKDTVTYIYDHNSGDAPKIASSADITRSGIPKRAYDDDDNISYSSDYTYSLALVRLVNKTAADIVIYEDVEF